MANTGSISAQVFNLMNNQPIDGASVKLGGPQTGEATTAPNGDFKLSNLASSNNYTLDVSAGGFVPEHYEDIVVIGDNDTNLGKFMLRPED